MFAKLKFRLMEIGGRGQRRLEVLASMQLFEMHGPMSVGHSDTRSSFRILRKRQTGKRQPRPTFNSSFVCKTIEAFHKVLQRLLPLSSSGSWRQLTIFGEKIEDTDEDRAQRMPKNNFVFFVAALKIIRSRAA
jgi:hypothetical protein